MGLGVGIGVGGRMGDMWKVTLICVGAIKTSWICEGCAYFCERLKSDCKLEVIELTASKARDAQGQIQEESKRIIDALKKRKGVVWILDKIGKQMYSEEFSHALSAFGDRGQSLTIVLGGAYGLNDAVHERADRMLSLSPMTFPHELCRLIFFEQLYRAVQIGKGSGYHH